MLEATPRDSVLERKALVVNPCKTCQPVGAIYAALGVHGVMPHSHGSQGCVSFHRMFLTRHFKEPAMASTSAFTEGASVFGGGANLKASVRNIFDLYDPEIIAVHTTCLSETIGDDLFAFISALEIPEGKRVIYCNTPSYQGSHITGFSAMTAGFVEHLATKSDVSKGKSADADAAVAVGAAAAGRPESKLAVIPGFVNPADMRKLKAYLEAFKINYTMLPDTSGVFDAPMTGDFEMYPKGGTPSSEIVALGDASYSLALGEWASEAAANTLKRKFDVDYQTLPLPIGIEATDSFITELARFSKEPVPYAIEEERGQLVDCMLDSHQYLDKKRVAIAGDPDHVLGLTAFALELGMVPAFIGTGTPGGHFEEKVQALLDGHGIPEGSCWYKSETDYFEIHQRIIQEPVDLILGPSLFKQIARAEDIPLVRVGFPVLDRYAHQYVPLVGYQGALYLLRDMLNAVMDRQDRDCDDKDLEFVM
jgi:nitrogenase molybdenum-iron protein beta chain